MNDIIIDAVLDVRRLVLGIKELALVSLVLREQQLRTALAVKPAATVVVMVGLDGCDLHGVVSTEPWLALIQSP